MEKEDTIVILESRPWLALTITSLLPLPAKYTNKISRIYKKEIVNGTYLSVQEIYMKQPIPKKYLAKLVEVNGDYYGMLVREQYGCSVSVTDSRKKIVIICFDSVGGTNESEEPV